MKEKEKQLNTWEKLFNIQFCGGSDETELLLEDLTAQDIKSFIHQLLLQEKQEWLEEIREKIKKMKKDEFSESGQIEMPKGYNPDYLPDVVYCANNTICRKYNEAIDEILNLLNEI